MAEPTPGETAYVVYRSVVLPSDWRVAAPAWVALPALHKAAWEAAAQAVLAATVAPPPAAHTSGLPGQGRL